MKTQDGPIQVKVCPRCGAETPLFAGPIRHCSDCPRNPSNSDQTMPRNPPQPSATVEP